MRRFGFSGLKFSPKQQGARRYLDTDVKRVEELCGVGPKENRHAQAKLSTRDELGAYSNREVSE